MLGGSWVVIGRVYKYGSYSCNPYLWNSTPSCDYPETSKEGPFKAQVWLELCGFESNIGALIIRIGCWGPLYYRYNKEPLLGSLL